MAVGILPLSPGHERNNLSRDRPHPSPPRVSTYIFSFTTVPFIIMQQVHIAFLGQAL